MGLDSVLKSIEDTKFCDFANDVGAAEILVSDPQKIRKAKRSKIFAIELAQLYDCLNRILNGQITLSYMLAC